MKSPESGSSATDVSPHHESPMVRANEHSPSKEAASQAIPSVEEPTTDTTTSQEQEEMYTSQVEISEPRKSSKWKNCEKAGSTFQGLCYVTELILHIET